MEKILFCLIAFFAIVLLYIYNRIKFQDIRIKDCSKNSMFYLPKNVKHPYQLTAYLEGQIDGKGIRPTKYLCELFCPILG